MATYKNAEKFRDNLYSSLGLDPERYPITGMKFEYSQDLLWVCAFCSDTRNPSSKDVIYYPEYFTDENYKEPVSDNPPDVSWVKPDLMDLLETGFKV